MIRTETKTQNQARQFGLLSRREVADLLHVCTRTVARWEQADILPGRIKIGNQVFFEKAKLITFLHENLPDWYRDYLREQGQRDELKIGLIQHELELGTEKGTQLD
jgi:hypothetical protein